MQLSDGDGRRNRDNDPQDNEYDVIRQGIADNQPDILGREKEFKVFESYPLALQKALDESAMHFVILKGDDNTEHRREAEQQIPYGGGKGQQRQFRIVAPPFPPFC